MNKYFKENMKFYKLYKLVMEEHKILPDGREVWLDENGEFHREDGPAVIWPKGEMIYDNHTGEELPDPLEEWFFHGEPHRIGGPAKIWNNGVKEWFLNGECHREDGPAFENSDGYKQWWLHDKQYSEQDYKRELIKQHIIKDPTVSDIMDAI